MIFLLLIHTAISLCAAGTTALLFDERSAISLLLGTVVMLVDLGVLCLVWPWIFAKKKFALSIGVIVFKFAILAWIMNEAVGAAKHQQIYLGWFAVGIALIAVTGIAAAARQSVATDKATNGKLRL